MGIYKIAYFVTITENEFFYWMHFEIHRERFYVFLLLAITAFLESVAQVRWKHDFQVVDSVAGQTIFF